MFKATRCIYAVYRLLLHFSFSRYSSLTHTHIYDQFLFTVRLKSINLLNDNF